MVFNFILEVNQKYSKQETESLMNHRMEIEKCIQFFNPSLLLTLFYSFSFSFSVVVVFVNTREYSIYQNI